MIFSSIQYLLFLPIVVFLYWRTKGAARLTLIVASSYFFYMSFLPLYGILLFLLTLFNWKLGLHIHESISSSRNQQARHTLWLGLFVNLASLCYYKYTDFIFANLAQSLSMVRSLGLTSVPTWDAPVLNIILPLGISFFVFEFIHYLADIYAGNKPIKSLMEFTAFAAFFPSQIAGPIKRFQDFQLRLSNPEALTSTVFFEASALIMQGLFKKVAIADPIGALVSIPFTTLTSLSAADAALAMFGFAIQIYCDFSGYTDIGRGSALLLGIRLPINFNLPYLAADVTEFWRRWHISLSSWLRDYVYIPLGGSRAGKLLSWRNTMITMLLCGLWHGASWHYVMFGGVHGIALVINKQWRTFLDRHAALNAVTNSKPGRAASIAMTALFASVAFAVFRTPDLQHMVSFFSCFKNIHQQCCLLMAIEKVGLFQILFIYLSFWLITEYLGPRPKALPRLRGGQIAAPLRFSAPVRLASWTAALLLMFAVRPTVAVPFIYFQF